MKSKMNVFTDAKNCLLWCHKDYVKMPVCFSLQYEIWIPLLNTIKLDMLTVVNSELTKRRAARRARIQLHQQSFKWLSFNKPRINIYISLCNAVSKDMVVHIYPERLRASILKLDKFYSNLGIGYTT